MNELENHNFPNKSHDEIDFIDSIIFLWQTRFFILSGLALGASLALFFGLRITKYSGNIEKSEIVLSPVEGAVGDIIPTLEGLESQLFSLQGSDNFVEALKKASSNASSGNGSTDFQSAKSVISSMDFDDEKNLRISLNTSLTNNGETTFERSIVAALNEVIQQRNAKIRQNLLAFEENQFQTSQIYSQISLELILIAQAHSKPGDLVASQILQAAIADGASIESVKRMFLVISIIPNDYPNKQDLLQKFKVASQNMVNAKTSLDTLHSRSDRLASISSWKTFEFKNISIQRSNNTLLNSSRIVKIVLVGLVIGAFAGAAVGGAVIFWRANRKRLRAIFQKKLSQDAY